MITCGIAPQHRRLNVTMHPDISKKTPNTTERQYRYNDNQEKKDLVKVCVWVPQRRREELLRIVKSFREFGGK